MGWYEMANARRVRFPLFPDGDGIARQRSMLKSLNLFAIAALYSIGLQSFAAAPYSFTILAQNGQTVNGQTIFSPSNAVMNDNGDVAFDARVLGPIAPPNVYRTSFNHSASGPALVAAGSKPQLANNGTIVFGCTAGLCSQSGVLVAYGSTIGGRTITNLDTWAMSRNGRVVFTSSWSRVLPDLTTLSQYGLFTPTTLLAETCEYVFPNTTGCYAGGAAGTRIEGQQLLVIAFPAINNSGEIAFGCAFAFAQDGICTDSRVVDYPGSVISGDTLTLLKNPELNNAGTILFLADFGNNASGLFTSSKALVQTGDVVSGYEIQFVDSGTINSSGNIAFVADFITQPGAPLGSGLFTSSGVVLKTGDQIADQTVEQILDATLNNNGDILITATLSKAGGSAIIAASPHGK